MIQKGFLPIALAIYDYSYARIRRPLSEDRGKSSWLDRGHYRQFGHVLPAVFIGSSSILTTFAADDVRSTYICPHSSVMWRIIPFLQILGTFLDCYILICIDIIIKQKRKDSSLTDTAAPLVISSLFFVSASYQFQQIEY